MNSYTLNPLYEEDISNVSFNFAEVVDSSLSLNYSSLNFSLTRILPLTNKFFDGKQHEHRMELQTEDLRQWEIWGYSIVVPAICLLGIGVNILSLFVFFLGDLKESLYTYLTVLSVADLVTVILMLLSGIARGFGRSSFAWTAVDAFLHIPIASFSTTVSVLTLVTVTLERLIIIKFPIDSRRYCVPSIARKCCFIIFIFSVIFNIPYCLIFGVSDGEVIYSGFSSTRYYKIHNWIRLVLLGFLPGLILIACNILLLHSLKSSHKRRISLMKPIAFSSSDPPSTKSSECTSDGAGNGSLNTEIIVNKIKTPSFSSVGDKVSKTGSPSSQLYSQQRRITLVLIAMICSFIVGELPTHIASRSSAISLLFPSRPHLFYSTPFRIFKLLSTILVSCHYSGNFFLYCAFNKRFIRELKRIWTARVKPIIISEERCFNQSTSNQNQEPIKTEITVPAHLERKRVQRKPKGCRTTRIIVNVELLDIV